MTGILFSRTIQGLQVKSIVVLQAESGHLLTTKRKGRIMDLQGPKVDMSVSSCSRVIIVWTVPQEILSTAMLSWSNRSGCFAIGH